MKRGFRHLYFQMSPNHYLILPSTSKSGTELHLDVRWQPGLVGPPDRDKRHVGLGRVDREQGTFLYFYNEKNTEKEKKKKNTSAELSVKRKEIQDVIHFSTNGYGFIRP